MFQDSEICRPLYDTLNGGPPRAFECRLTIGWDEKDGFVFTLNNKPRPDASPYKCGKVTRTERGMKMHLKLVHGFEAQQCLFQKESAATQHAETKK